MAAPSPVPSPGGQPSTSGALPDAETSLDLVRRARDGDRDAENRICARYLPRLHRWAHGRLPRGARPAMETGDLVQEVLLRAIRSFPVFEPRHEGAFPAYLRRIMANRLTDLGRADQRQPLRLALETDADVVSQAASPLDEAMTEEGRRRFDRAFDTLSVKDQDLVFLRLELGYGWDDVAAMLGSTPNAVRVATHRALVRLAAAMATDSPA